MNVGEGMDTGKSHKLLPLEALRGIAAFIVVIYHFFMAFLPEYVANVYVKDIGKHSSLLIGTPLYFFFNGTMMTDIFFGLSGYVLTLKCLRLTSGRQIVELMIKRWFRLVPLCIISVSFSCLLFWTHFYHFQDAGKLSHSHWLNYGAFINLSQSFQPHVSSLFLEGLIRPFTDRENPLNSNMWTINYEYFGSLMVFALVGCSMFIKPALLGVFAVLFMACGVVYNQEIYSLFFLGAALATCINNRIKLHNSQAIMLFFLGIYAGGYSYVEGWYSWLSYTSFTWGELVPLFYTISATALILVFATNNIISRQFNGSISRLLGKWSFSAYIIHLIIIGSFSSWGYAVCGGGVIAILVALMILALVLFPLVIVLSECDVWVLHRLSAWHPLSGKQRISDEKAV